jgi:hypothetical protein
MTDSGCVLALAIHKCRIPLTRWQKMTEREGLIVAIILAVIFAIIVGWILKSIRGSWEANYSSPVYPPSSASATIWASAGVVNPSMINESLITPLTTGAVIRWPLINMAI